MVTNSTRTILIIVALIIVMGLVVAWILGAFGGGDSVVTGDVVYRERIALPEGAVVTVSITNASLMDVPVEPVGEQIINNPGQVPIPYEVTYNPDDIDERLNYSVGARITDGQGNLLFISDTATFVITNGNPTESVVINVVQVGR